MTKDELLQYSWSRDFTYKDILHVAGMMTDVEVPTEDEYNAYCKQAFESMLRFMDREYEDRLEGRDRARQELGWGFVKESGVGR